MTEQVRALVPGWVEWLGPLLFLVGLAATLGLVPVAAVRAAARRISPTDHWAEQARYVHAARVSVVWAVAFVPVGAWLFSTVAVGPVARLPSWLLGGAGALVAVVVAARVSWWLEGEVLRQPVPGWRSYLGNFLARLLPLAAILVIGLAAPSRLSSPWMVLWLPLAFGVGLVLRYHLDLLGRFGMARVADDHVTSIVAGAAARAGMEVPAVFVIHHHRPNAFAFPWRGAVAFTSRALAELSDEELESVALHELGHMTEASTASLFRQAAQFIWIPVAAVKPILGSWGGAGLMALGGFLVVVLFGVRRFATAMENRSDRHAVAEDGSRVYGGALEKIYRIGFIPAVLRSSTHGRLQDRLQAAGMVVDFQSPAPPPIRALAASTALAVMVDFGIFLTPYAATVGADLASPTPAHVALALGGYGSWPFERLGQLADVGRDFEAAEVFYTAAVETSSEPDLLVSLAYVRSLLGRCDDAQHAVASLADRDAGPGDVSLAAEWVDWCEDQFNGL